MISQTVALKTLSRRFEIILALYLWVKAWNFLDALILAQSFNLWVLTTFPFWIFIDFEPLLRPKYWIKDLSKYGVSGSAVLEKKNLEDIHHIFTVSWLSHHWKVCFHKETLYQILCYLDQKIGEKVKNVQRFQTHRQTDRQMNGQHVQVIRKADLNLQFRCANHELLQWLFLNPCNQTRKHVHTVFFSDVLNFQMNINKKKKHKVHNALITTGCDNFCSVIDLHKLW